MEDAVKAGLVRQLGISNLMSLEQLREIYAAATIRPAVVQQRFSEESGYENEMRAWCAEAGIYFQSAGTLALNKDAVRSDLMGIFAAELRVPYAIVFIRFVMGLGIVPHIGAEKEGDIKEYLA